MNGPASEIMSKPPPLLQRWMDTLLVTVIFRIHYIRGMRYIYRFIRQLMKNRPLTLRYGNGWITVTEKDYIPNEIILKGCYEIEVWDALALVAESNEILWDVGANIGSFSLNALYQPQIQEIHCFEPDPQTVASLKHNLSLNKHVDKARIYPLALGAVNQDIAFYFGSNPAINSAARNSGLGSITVPCYTIDALVETGQANAPTLLKVDVEDWDKDVIRGAERLLSTNPPKAIVFEAECTAIGNIVDDEFTDYLLSKGYSIHHIMRPSGRIFFTPVTSNYIENYIAIHKSRGLERIVL